MLWRLARGAFALLTALFLGSNRVSAQVGDLYVSVTQSAVDKILSDVPYPFTVLERWYPFEGLAQQAYTAKLSEKKKGDLVTWAGQNERSSEAAREIVARQTALLAELDEVLQSKKIAEENHQKWTGPTDAELRTWRNLDFDTRAHLAYLKIFLPTRPGITLNGPRTDINDLRVSSDAIGEWWVKRPKVECVRVCQIGPIKFCCEYKVIWVWEKWATVSVNDFTVNTDVTLFGEVDALAVYLRASFRRLRIDIPIIRDIPLEGIANQFLGARRFAVMDLRQLIASLPYINNRYRIKAARLTGTRELRADIEIEKF